MGVIKWIALGYAVLFVTEVMWLGWKIGLLVIQETAYYYELRQVLRGNDEKH